MRVCAICGKPIGIHADVLAHNFRVETKTQWTYSHRSCVEMYHYQVEQEVLRFIEGSKMLYIKMRLIAVRRNPHYKGDKWR